MPKLGRLSGSADLFSSNLREVPAFRALLRAVEARLFAGLELPGSTLDLGCGDGHFGSTAFESPLAVGMDSSLISVRTAYARSGVYRGVLQGGGEQLPFADAAFGSAVSNSVLEHIPNVQRVLQEIGRVLHPGAPFVFTVPSEFFCEFLSVRRAFSRLGLCSMAWAYERFFNRISRHHHYHSLDEWRALLRQAGFEIELHRYYCSRQALWALEWGHFFGLPALVSKKLTGRWILAPVDANLWLTKILLRRYYEEPLPVRGAYLFVAARRCFE